LIDLHSHILPGIDDGAADLSVSLAMARLAVADGIRIIACTPHILPGVYNNRGSDIRAAVAALSAILDQEKIPLSVVVGADAHVAPDMINGLRSGEIPTLSESRYFLLEPPHHVVPPRFDDFAFRTLTAGFVPILTHPERLTWIETNYQLVTRLSDGGVWMQITAGSLTGQFGRRARYLSERMLDEDRVQILATDAHDTVRRPPALKKARDLVASQYGEERADRLVLGRPLDVLENRSPSAHRAAEAGQPPQLRTGQGR
jgi:protein-tyrosine phosphatase